MKGWLIFKHAVFMVLRNWRDALQVGLVPVAIAVLAGGALIGVGGLDQLTSTAMVNPDDLMDPGLFGRFLLATLIWAICMLWIVVNWHRFVLLEEFPQGWIPPLRGGPMLGYLGRFMMLVLLGLLLMIPGAMVAGIFMAVPLFGSFVLIAFYIVAIILFYRVIAILPAAAVEKPLRLGEAFEATRGANVDIVVIVVLHIALSLLLQAVVLLVGSVLPLIATVMAIPANLAMSLVGVSILTTFYGHYVEGRPVD